jgi:hypothetical protein
MPILDTKVDPIGQSGQVPKLIYIETDDSLAEVQAPGYLNKLVREGIPIDTTSMALIITRETPSSKPVTNLYKISKVGADYNVFAVTDSTVYGATNLGSGIGVRGLYVNEVGGVLQFKSLRGTQGIEIDESSEVLIIKSTVTGFNPAYTYDGSAPANPSITGNWRHIGEFNVQAGSGNVILQSDTGSISLLAPNAGQTIFATASNLTATIGNQISLTASTQMFLSSGGPLTLSATTPVTGQITLNSPKLAASTSLVSAVTSNVLYYDTGTGAITHGLAPGGGSDWNLTGTNSGAGLKLGTNAANGWEYVANGNTFCTVSATGTTTWTGATTFNNVFTINSGFDITIASAQSVLITGDLRLGSTNLLATSQILYYNDISNLVTYGPVPSSGWDLTGTNSGAGLEFGTSTANGWSYVTNNAPFCTVSAAGLSTWSGGASFTGSFNVNSPSAFIQSIGNLNLWASNNINIFAGAGFSVEIGGVLSLTTVPAGVTPQILYWDSTTFQVTQGPAPSSSVWNLTGTNSGAGLRFGTNSPNGWEYVVDSVPFLTVSNGGIATWSGDIDFTGLFSINSPTSINLITTTDIKLIAPTGVQISNDLFLTNPSAGTAVNVLYYNPVSKLVSHAVAPAAFDPAANYTTTGDWDNSGDWGFTGETVINSGANLVSITSSNATPINITNTTGGVVLNGPAGANIGFTNSFGHLTATAPLVAFTATNINYSTGGGVTANYSGPNLNYTVNGDFNVNCVAVKLNTIALSSKPDQLYYDTVTKRVSYGPVSAFDTAANYTTTGEWLNQNDWTFEAGFVVNNGNNIAAITSTSAVPINITNIVGGVVASGNIATLNATTGDATVSAALGNIAITSSTGQVAINANDVVGIISDSAVIDCVGQVALQSDLEVRIAPTDLFIENLPAVSTDTALCYDPITFRVTQAVLAFQPVQNWVAITVPGTYTPLPNTTYFVDALNVIFELPLSVPTNAQFEFVGQNRNFVINANLGQSIRSISTVGVTITTLSLWNSFVIKCTDANTSFQVTQLMGNIDLT